MNTIKIFNEDKNIKSHPSPVSSIRGTIHGGLKFRVKKGFKGTDVSILLSYTSMYS